MPEKVSIIIPAYNEAGAIGEVITQIDQVMVSSGHPYEIVVVDDGSEDNTYEVVEKASKTLGSVSCIRHQENRGYGSALKMGIRRAKGEIIVITDADGTYPNGAIPELLREMGNNDMVVGARTGESVHIPLVRKPAKWMLNKIANYLSETKIPDLNSGMRAFRKEDVLNYFNILPKGFSFTTTITLAMVADGFSVRYIPIDYGKRMGKSKVKPRNTFDFLMLILRTIMYFNPLKILLPISMTLLLTGMGLFSYRFLVVHNIAQLEILLILSGLQIGVIGLLADVVVKRDRHRREDA